MSCPPFLLSHKTSNRRAVISRAIRLTVNIFLLTLYTIAKERTLCLHGHPQKIFQRGGGLFTCFPHLSPSLFYSLSLSFSHFLRLSSLPLLSFFRLLSCTPKQSLLTFAVSRRQFSYALLPMPAGARVCLTGYY